MSEDIQLNEGERIVTLVEIPLKLDRDIIERMKERALYEIRNDEQALLQYIIPKALEALIAQHGRRFDTWPLQLQLRMADSLVLEGPEHDAAIIGIGHYTDKPEPDILVYDWDDMLTALMAHNDWDYDTAADWRSINTFGGWNGEGTPVSFMPFDAGPHDVPAIHEAFGVQALGVCSRCGEDDALVFEPEAFMTAYSKQPNLVCSPEAASSGDPYVDIQRYKGQRIFLMTRVPEEGE